MAEFANKVEHRSRKREIRSEGSVESCPICLQAMCEPAVLIPCKHRFCVACCLTYLRSNIDTQTAPCPICRVDARLVDVVTESGENLRALQLRERLASEDESLLYFDVLVEVQTVNFGDAKQARHPIGEQALTPSAKTPDLWEICDSCFFCIKARAQPLPAGSYRCSLHVKRLDNFECHEPVHATLFTDDGSVSSRRDLDFNFLPPNQWTFFQVGTIDLIYPGGFSASLMADRRDWWKSGLIVDCIAVQSILPSRRRRSRSRQKCTLS